MNKKQRGVGMLEAVVGLFLLTFGISAMVAVQIKAVTASHESLKRVEAMNVAKNFVGIVQTNPSQMAVYGANSSSNAAFESLSSVNCSSVECSPADKAKYDLWTMYSDAKEQELAVRTSNCEGNSNRKCIYVSWGDTNPTHGTAENDCTTTAGGRLVVKENAQCIFLEGF